MQRFLASLAIMLAVFTAKVAAHHSIATFDNQNPKMLNGMVNGDETCARPVRDLTS